MTDLEPLLRRVASDLGSVGARWALVGALAVGARSKPRFTADLDLALAVASDDEAEHIVAQLRASGYVVGAIMEHRTTGRLATVRLGTEEGGEEDVPVVDLLFASCGIEPEVASEAEVLEVFPGVQVPVARAGHLVAMKLLSRSEGRPLDQADLFALIASADAAEIERAREAVRLIAERGFDRGRDLVADLEAALAPG